MGTSRTLVKFLKKYHHKMVSRLCEEEAELDARLRKRQDYEEETEKLKKFTQQTTEKCRKKKTRNIRSLLGNREVLRKKKRKHRRKKKHRVDNKKEQQRTRNQNKVLNISNVPLSSDERDLLSRAYHFAQDHLR